MADALLDAIPLLAHYARRAGYAEAAVETLCEQIRQINGPSVMDASRRLRDQIAALRATTERVEAGMKRADGDAARAVCCGPVCKRPADDCVAAAYGAGILERAKAAGWLASRGGAGAGEDADALSRVRRFIAEHGASRFPAVKELASGGMADDDRPTVKRAGFRKTLPEGDAFLFFPEIWAGEVFDGADATAGAKALAAAGFLVPGEGKKLQKRVRVPGWAKGNGPRFYCVKAAIMESDDAGGEVAA